MFAPQPIRFQYNDAGLLGQAAALAGAQSRQSYGGAGGLWGGPAPGDPFHDLPPQADQLQQAGRLLQQQPEGSSASGNYFSMASPVTQSISNAKALARSSQIDDNDLTDDQKNQIDSLQKDNNVGLNEFNGLIQGVSQGVKSRSQKQQVQQDQQSKQAIVSSVKGQVAPEDTDTLNQYANDPRFSMNDLRMAVQQSVKKQSDAADLKVQQDTKANLAQQAQNFVHPDELPQIQQLASDPRVTTQQFHQAVVASHQHMLQATAQAQSQQNTKTRLQAATLKSEISELQKDPTIGLIKDEADAKSFGPEVEANYLKLKQKRQQLSDLDQQLQGQGGNKYVEGSILHSPSTGKNYKVVNGQPTEITNGG